MHSMMATSKEGVTVEESLGWVGLADRQEQGGLVGEGESRQLGVWGKANVMMLGGKHCWSAGIIMHACLPASW